MDKYEHARRLRAAMAEAGKGREIVADYTGRGVRTVTNWTSDKKPTLPSDTERAALRRLFPGYDDDADPVERAVRGSGLEPHRQTKVIGYYQEQLYEQRREVGA